MITSTHNPKLKLVRALQGRAKERRETGAFFVEGVRLVEEAIISNWGFRFVLYDETLNERGRSQVEGLRSRGVDVEEISTSLMKSLSETESPQGIVAVLELNQLPIPAQIKFIGIEAEDLSPGEKLSQPVLAVLEQAANLIEDSVKIFLQPS